MRKSNREQRFSVKGDGRSKNREIETFKHDREKSHQQRPRSSYSSYDAKVVTGRTTVQELRVQSDIKNHVRYHNIRIKMEDEQKMRQTLKEMLIEHVGPITHVSTQKTNSSPGSDYTVNFVVGFRYDSDALNYLEERKEYLIKNGDDIINFQPTSTPVFQTLIPTVRQRKAAGLYLRQSEAKLKKSIAKPNKQRKSFESSKSSSYSDSESSRGQRESRSRRRRDHYESIDQSSSSGSSNRSNERSYQRKHHKKEIRDHKHKHKHSKRESTPRSQSKDIKKHEERSQAVLIWGIPSQTYQKTIASQLNQMKQGPFQPLYLHWRKLPNSEAEYLKVKLPKNKAEKLLNCSHKLIINSCPVVVTRNFESKQKLLDNLRQFQVLLHFPSQVDAFNVYSRISGMARIVQMVSQQVVRDGCSTSFLLTMANPGVARQLKKLIKTSAGIIISQPFQGHLVYRPTKKTILPRLKLFQ